MRTAISILALAVSAAAANIPITVVGATQTQIVIQYTATNSGPCTVTAADDNGGPANANDLNTALFANSNLDTSRTAANGFRWQTQTDASGFIRTVIIGGYGEYKLALDGKYYSTALQVASHYTITVVCGADSGAVDTLTSNIPQGMTFPAMPIPTPGSPLGGFPQPTIDWSRGGPSVTLCGTGRQACYIDAITGVLIKRVTGGDDSFADSLPEPLGLFQTIVIDVLGSTWTSPQNFVINQTPSLLASTSTANAPIFAAFDPTFAPASQGRFSDITVNTYGSSSVGTVAAGFCLSIDSGQTCANRGIYNSTTQTYTPITVQYGTTVGCQPTGNCANDWVPSKNPSSNFSAWGGMATAFGNADITNVTFGGVNAAGSTVTNTNTGGPWFYLGLVPGSKFQLTGTGCPAGLLTVATLNSGVSITTVETGLSGTGCVYNDMHAGIRAVKLSGTGILNVSMTAHGWDSRSFLGGTSGAHYDCAKTKVTYNTDCDGVVGTGTGFLCGMLEYTNQFSVYLVQDSGRMCIQSSGYVSAGGPGHITGAGGVPGAWTAADTYIGTSPSGHLWKMQHIANNYQEMPSDPLHTLDNKFTYTDLGSTTDFMNRAIAGNSGLPGGVTELTHSMWSSAWGFESPVDDNAGGTAIQFNAQIGGDLPCLKAWFDSTGAFLSYMPSFGSFPNGYNVCHSAPRPLVDGYSEVDQGGSDNSLGPHRYNSSQPLGGPYISHVTSIRKNGTFHSQAITISTCTKASPAVCTSSGHNLDPIDSVATSQGALGTISGATGTGWSTGLNATLYAHKIDNNTFSLYSDPQGNTPLNSIGYGTLGGTIIFTTSPPLYSLAISAVSNVSGNARLTINTSEGGTSFYYPSINANNSIANVMFDADPVTIVQSYMNSTTQYYIAVPGGAHCSGCAANQVDIYSDSALTTPVTFATLSGTSGYHVIYAERCPDPTGITWPTGFTYPTVMLTDTGIGTTGAGLQKIRCVTVRHGSEFESDFPASGENAVYPPCSGSGTPAGCTGASAEASNTQKSMLHVIHIGDGAVSTVDYALIHEINMAVAITRTNENQIDVTWVRDYGDDIPYQNRGSNAGMSDSFALQHSPGWSMGASGIIGPTLVGFMTNPPTYFAPPANGCHFDVGMGSVTNTLTSASTWIPGSCSPDDKVDVSIATYSNNTVTRNHNSHPAFSLSDSYSLVMGQSYPSKRQIASTNGGYTPANEMVWKADWMAPNIDNGTGQNFGDNAGCFPTVTPIAGTTVYKITTCNGSNNTKITPLYVAHQGWAYYVDVSARQPCTGGNPNCWNQADKTRCSAYGVNECVVGSSVGDIYVSDKLGLFRPDFPGCISNDSYYGGTCAFGLWPGMGWAVQVRQTPIDTNGTGVRRLTQAFSYPFGQYYASNWTTTPDGKWGFFAVNPIQQHPRFREASGMDYFAARIPPWAPVGDGKDRTNYIPTPVVVQPADTAVIRFGYANNWPPGQLQNGVPPCTTRQDPCITSAAANATQPFDFGTDTPHPTGCTTGCTINIPAAPGQVVIYQVLRTTGGVTTTGPVSVIPDTFSPTTGAANIVTAGGTPQSTGINTAFGTPLEVTVTDGGSNPLAGLTVTFTAPGSSATASFSGGTMSANSVTDSLGHAYAPTLTANANAGTYTVVANTSGLSITANFILTNTGAPPPTSSKTPTAGKIGAAGTVVIR